MLFKSEVYEEENMFNSDVKNQAIDRLEGAVDKYNKILKEAEKGSLDLFNVRTQASALIKDIEWYINTLANSPKEFQNEIQAIHINAEKFNNIFDLKIEGESVSKVSGSMAGAGILAGVGTAALAPTAAMAVATTFGTASTGAAIASLSGAAATKAALAWLGGGALAAGGGGIAGGTALLTLAGPVGWAIGLTTLVGSGLFASKKNREIAQKATDEAILIEKEIAKYRAIALEIRCIIAETSKFISNLHDSQVRIKRFFPKNYLEFTINQKQEMGAFINSTLALSKIINRRVG